MQAQAKPPRPFGADQPAQGEPNTRLSDPKNLIMFNFPARTFSNPYPLLQQTNKGNYV
jgi:hypothetical protein